MSKFLLKRVKHFVEDKLQLYITRHSKQLPHRIGSGCSIDPRADFVGYTENIQIGNNVRIGQNALISCDDSVSFIYIGDGTILQPYSMVITCTEGKVVIGRSCSVNPFCVLYGLGGLSIGNHVRIATHTVIVPANHIFEDRDTPITKQGLTQKGVVVEDDVWIGAGVKILDGCTVGKGSILGAGTVLTKSIEPYSVVVGVPGRVVRKRGE